MKREADARAVVTPGEIAYWPDGHASPSASAARRSRRATTRLASPCNIWAKVLGDVKALRAVRVGTKIT